jgi:hypothetical protein
MTQPTMHDLVVKYYGAQKKAPVHTKYIYRDLTKEKEVYEKRAHKEILQHNAHPAIHC